MRALLHNFEFVYLHKILLEIFEIFEISWGNPAYWYAANH